jgi:Ni,Fe-hydrogenase I large subunit
MAKIVIDPVTRLEGHLRIEVVIDGNNRVTDAWASSTMFRGIELILKGRDPRDAWHFTQRICGVCTMVHALASIRAVENALDIQIPDNARIIRNIITGTQFLQDHVIHFYHLHALDWVDIVSALDADPRKTAQIGQSISNWPNSGTSYFKAVKERLKNFVASGQLGIFANGYWGHSAYKLPPEVNLLAVSHYLEALHWQREIIKIHALLGGKNPHLQTYLVGGMALPLDLNSPSALNAQAIATISSLLQKAKEFVQKVYIPDLLAIASYYREWAKIGRGVGNYMCCGEFPLDSLGTAGKYLFPAGIILNGNLREVLPFNQEKITEYVTHSWYKYSADDGMSKHPWEGETIPNYTGPQPPYEFLAVEDKYSWLKAPRYDDRPMEVGPLARILVAYALGQEKVKKLVDDVLNRLKLTPEALFSTLGRTAARGIETLIIAEELPGWLDELVENLSRGNLKIHNGEKWDPSTWPKEIQGVGFHEAPRGTLGHWIKIKDKQIEDYQCVVPSTWNASPRDARGNRGPYEEALLETPIADPQKPIEILRTIHSFDPCMACGVHLFDLTGKEITQVLVQSF